MPPSAGSRSMKQRSALVAPPGSAFVNAIQDGSCPHGDGGLCDSVHYWKSDSVDGSVVNREHSVVEDFMNESTLFLLTLVLVRRGVAVFFL